MFPARNRLVAGRVSVFGPGSIARWLRNWMDGVVIQDEAPSRAVTSDKAQGARAPRELLVGPVGRRGWRTRQELRRPCSSVAARPQARRQ